MANVQSLLDLAAPILRELPQEFQNVIQEASAAMTAPSKPEKEAEPAPEPPGEGDSSPVMESENMDPECMAAEIPQGTSATPRDTLQIPDALQRPKTVQCKLTGLQKSLVLSEVLGRPVSQRGRGRAR